MNTDRMAANLGMKISASVGYRADLQFADARKINKATAHFMLSYNGECPSSEDIAQFFIRQYNAKITPFLSTAKVYNSKRVITVVGQILNITRDVSDIGRREMKTVIQGSVYLDVPLKEIWEISERNGQKVLVRKMKDDIMALVQARKDAMMDQSSQMGLSFANLAKANLMKFLAVLEKGDKVRVLLGDKPMDAEVLAVTDTDVKVKTASGVDTVSRQHVLDVLAKSPAKEEAVKDEAVKYYTEAYGDEEYAKQLTT